MEATSWSTNSQVFRWIFSHSIHNHTDTSKLVTFTFWSVSAVVSLIHGLRKHRVQHCHHHRTHFQSRQTGRTGIGSTPLTQPCLRYWGPRPGRTVQWINWQDHGTKQKKRFLSKSVQDRTDGLHIKNLKGSFNSTIVLELILWNEYFKHLSF